MCDNLVCVCVCVGGGVRARAGVQVWMSEGSCKCSLSFTWRPWLYTPGWPTCTLVGILLSYLPSHHQNTEITDVLLCLALCGFWDLTLVGMLVWLGFLFMCTFGADRTELFDLGLRKTYLLQSKWSWQPCLWTSANPLTPGRLLFPLQHGLRR